MTFSLVSVSFVGVFVFGTVSCFNWDGVPEPLIYACAGRRVTFPWGFKTNQSEDVVDILWTFDGASSSLTHFVATMTHEHFEPNQRYSQRVRHMACGGFSLHDVTLDDSGHYSAEVRVDKDGSVTSHRHSVYLQVADGLMIQGRQLKAQQDPLARWDDQTQQWVISLTCGRFTYVGQPPVRVIWTTPTGETMSSTGYDNGNFFLTLPSPVLGGAYTCHLPAYFLPDACVSHLGGDGEDRVKAGVTVDELKARLTLIEAELKTIKKDNSELRKDDSDLKESHSRLEERLSKAEEKHTVYASEFRDRISNLTDSIEDKAETTIAFHVEFSADPVQLGPRQRLVLDKVVTNIGSGYDAMSGQFQAPVSGTYMFVVNFMGDKHTFHYVHVLLEGNRVANSISHGDGATWDHASETVILHLNAGQRVWLQRGYEQSVTKSIRGGQWTTFSGFLIGADV